MRTMIVVFFFNDTATTEIYTLSLHDALPILTTDDADDPGSTPGSGEFHQFQQVVAPGVLVAVRQQDRPVGLERLHRADRKSTRLNSSHANISYAVFCLKKKKTYLSILHPT